MPLIPDREPDEIVHAALENKPSTCDGCIGKSPHKGAYWACQTCLRNPNIKDEYTVRKPTEATP